MSTAEVYDPTTNTWTATTNTMAGPRAEHTATHHGGTSKKVVLVGGYDTNDLSTVEVYDETTNSFGPLQTMPTSTAGPLTEAKRRDHAAVRLPDGRILIIGGRVGSYYLDTMFLVTDGVVAATNLDAKAPNPIGGPGAVLLPDGKVLVISGTSLDGGGERYMRTSFTISVAGTTATVTPRAELPVARLRSIGFVANVGPNKDRAMFVGGAITSATSEKTRVASEGGVMYDAAANTWLPLPLMASKRTFAAGGLLPGGRFLISGGAGDIVISGTANQDAEVLDFATMTWKSAGKMLEPRGAHTSAVLNDGSVLFQGGVRAITDGFITLTTGAERFTLQASSAACSADGECSSGFCADGVCCDKACAGQCEACDIAGSVGTCKPVVGEPRGKREKCRVDATSDPGCGLACNGSNTTACQYPAAAAACSSDACASGRETHVSTCDGAGKCKDVPKACGDYGCDTKTCKTTCVTRADCTNPAHFCEAGKCIPQQANGSACTREEACASGLCVDGTCCESKCDGQCQACDVPGQAGRCIAIKGKPHGARSDCEKDASDACKSKVCDGTNTAACAGTVGPCVNYACDDINKICKRVCAADPDCGSGFQCEPATGNCVPRTSRCVDSGELQSADGTRAKCNAFICRDGVCLNKCTSTNDCQNGFVCDGAGVCTPNAGQTSEDAGGCAMGTTSAPLPGLAAFLIALGLLHRRTRRHVRGA